MPYISFAPDIWGESLNRSGRPDFLVGKVARSYRLEGWIVTFYRSYDEGLETVKVRRVERDGR